MEPAIETIWLLHSSRKLRCWSATKGEGREESRFTAASCQTPPDRSTRRWCRRRPTLYTRGMASRAWWKSLRSDERTALVAAFGGWAVDAFDSMIYSLVVPTLIAVWGISRAEAGLVATATLLCSAAGGWLAGALSDRLGRVRMLQITIGWFACCSLLAGFTTSYPQLLAIRALQGLGFGGEWAVGAALVAEIIPARQRGRAVGTVQSGWALGWGAAAILYALLFSLLPAILAWRVLFWTGVLPALLILYIRGRVREPHRPAGSGVPAERRGTFLAIFAPGLLRTTMLASLMAAGMQGGY
jgi:MFS family permease